MPTLDLPLEVAVPLQVTCGVLIGWSYGHSAWRKTLGWALLGFSIALSAFFMASATSLSRMLVVLATTIHTVRFIDLQQETIVPPPLERIAYVLSPYETNRTSQVQPWLDLRGAAAWIGWTLLGSTTFTLLMLAPQPDGWGGAIMRWSLTLITFYSLVDWLVLTLRTGLRARGIEALPAHVHPALARSVHDFWSKRWNLFVHRWLYRNVFRPIARRYGVVQGVAAAFAVSTALHLWIMLAALGTWAAMMWSSFFVVQGVFLLIERKLQIRRQPAPIGRFWTLTVMLGSSWLFVYPMSVILLDPRVVDGFRDLLNAI